MRRRAFPSDQRSQPHPRVSAHPVCKTPSLGRRRHPSRFLGPLRLGALALCQKDHVTATVEPAVIPSRKFATSPAASSRREGLSVARGRPTRGFAKEKAATPIMAVAITMGVAVAGTTSSRSAPNVDATSARPIRAGSSSRGTDCDLRNGTVPEKNWQSHRKTAPRANGAMLTLRFEKRYSNIRERAPEARD
jgi:hypothetical protein